MNHKERSDHSVALRLTLECEGMCGDVLETLGRSLDLFARFPRQNLGSPEIEGAIGQTIPFDVLENGLVFVAKYDNFFPYESLEFYIETPGQLTHRESVIIAPQEAESGKVIHGMKADKVAYLAGRDIEIYVRLPARGPGWTSLKRFYSVDASKS